MASERAGRHEIEQGSKFTLVIKQKTAKALSLTVPPTTLLALADEALE